METTASSTLPGDTLKSAITVAPNARAAGLAGARLWPAVALVILYWAFHAVAAVWEMSMFHRFVSRFMFDAAILLAFTVWWLAASRVGWRDRLLGLGILVGGAIVATLLADPRSLGKMGLFGVAWGGFPFVITVWTLWLLLCKTVLTSLSTRSQRIVWCVLVVATWGCLDLVRWDGLDGGQRAAFAWRWSPTAEERFLKEHRSQNPATDAVAVDSVASSVKPLELRPGDWPEFRGPDRDNRIRGVKLATDWKSREPKLLWKHRVGPAWSSMIVVDGNLFTQEQREQQECTVCYDAATGQERWVHRDSARFDEPLSGAGPRGTPTFADGRIYSLGGTGVLNCLDAATGNLLWTQNVAIDADAVVAPGGPSIRQWGYSNSPLVVGDKVIVFAGGTHDKGLLAYRTSDGELAWSLTAGSDGYSSPQLATIGGNSQLLMHSNGGLFAVDPTRGQLLWKVPGTSEYFLPITQPQQVGDDRLLVQSDGGVALVDVSRDGDSWTARQRWDSNRLKLSLGDFVVHDGSIYGFDDGVFCCLDAETGKRRWKGGRYGHGQVLLLADQPALLVISENGEAVLLAANPQKLEELARFPAIEGKTWNHPIIAHGRLYVRNAEEMACYDLPLATLADN